MGWRKSYNKNPTDTRCWPYPRGYLAMHIVDISVSNQINQKWLAFLLILSSPDATSLVGNHVIVSNLILVRPMKIFQEA